MEFASCHGQQLHWHPQEQTHGHALRASVFDDRTVTISIFFLLFSYFGDMEQNLHIIVKTIVSCLRAGAGSFSVQTLVNPSYIS